MNIRSIINQYYNDYQLSRSKPPKADITLYDDLTHESVVFPVIPANMPEVGIAQKTEVFNGATQDITLLGTLELKTYSMSDFLLPVNKNYPFIRPKGSNGTEIKEFIENRIKERLVMRLAVTYSDGTEDLNMSCTVTSAKFTKDELGDMRANIEFLEYVYLTSTTQSTTQENNNLSS